MSEEKTPVPEIVPDEVSSEKGSEVGELKKRIEILEAQLRKEIPVAEDKEEIIKQQIETYIKELQQTPNIATPSSARDEAEEISRFEPDQQLGALISLTLEKGLPKALSVAQALNNPAILDELHDALVDHYYQELIEQGILKRQQ
ncbi:MAG: hypothetical protein US98_C0039G0002 [Parcubacteria group bacterium GW2011_GWC1_38_6]|nr:MAG: hypothetical protein UR98_C0002G0005 [Parcubacteria group bacterium GW2011_GWA1_36_12]KKQ76367.1 MAG: hypothetical protein US98_C0039G0002 [Parcubacteria group bacterium GW2011_GWC1_38_6]